MPQHSVYFKVSMKTVFENRPPRQLAPVTQDASADVVFISGGLKAAKNSRKLVRSNVLDDVSEALNCQPEELSFLFDSESTIASDSEIFDFPDSERRRTVIRNNQLDMAE